MFQVFLAFLVFLITLPIRLFFLVFAENAWLFFCSERRRRRLCTCHDLLAGELNEFQLALTTSYAERVAELRDAKVEPLRHRLGELQTELARYNQALVPYEYTLSSGRALSEHGQTYLSLRDETLLEVERVSCALRKARKMSDDELIRDHLEGYRVELQTVQGLMNEVERF